MRTPPAPVAPALLIWARQSIRLSQEDAARKIGVSVDRLAAWEDGDDVPTLAQVRTAARHYKRPLAVFFLPEPPADFQAVRDFRRVHGAPEGEWSPNLALAVRRAHEQREVVAELRTELEIDAPPRPTVEASLRDPVIMARQARALLNVPLEEQLGWSDQYQALNAWLSALDNAGVLVIQAKRIDTGEMRGVSVDDDEIPAIVLNGADSPRGRIFTLMHEFGHVLSHSSGLCDLGDENVTERRCNEFAANLLMPRDAFLEAPEVKRGPARGGWSEVQISGLADRFSVSRESVVRRLHTVELATWDFYVEKRRQYQKAYEKSRRTEKHEIPFSRMQVRDLGRPYVRLVFEAYHAHAITTADISDYLNVQLKHLPRMEHEAFRVAVA